VKPNVVELARSSVVSAAQHSKTVKTGISRNWHEKADEFC